MRILSFILIVFIAISCSKGISENDVLGKYKVTIKLTAAADTTDQASMMTIAMFSAADVQYEFQQGGTLNTTVKMGAIGQDNVQKWSLKGDSIFVDNESYFIEKADKGFVLKGGSINLNLEEID